MPPRKPDHIHENKMEGMFYIYRGKLVSIFKAISGAETQNTPEMVVTFPKNLFHFNFFTQVF